MSLCPRLKTSHRVSYEECIFSRRLPRELRPTAFAEFIDCSHAISDAQKALRLRLGAVQSIRPAFLETGWVHFIQQSQPEG
jgi:hypothetical protein